jgi:hypothetical protein
MSRLQNRTSQRQARAGAIACSLTFLLIGAGAFAQSNDNIADAVLLSGSLPITAATVSNSNATVQDGELDHYFDSIATRSLWWKWTPTVSQRVEVNATGHDTVMAIYTGSALNALNLVGNNDDEDFSKNSRIRFEAKAGSNYLIAVDGLHDQTVNKSGSVTVQIKAYTSTPPFNDSWASPLVFVGQPVSGSPLGSSSDNTNATVEEGEPVHLNTNSHTSTVWWKWTATATASVSTTADDVSIDTVMAVYSGPEDQTGQSFSSLSLIDANDDGEISSAAVVEFKAQQDTTYYFAVDGSIYDRGDIDFYLAAGQAAPANDNFASATVIPSTLVSETVAGRNSGATAETNEPDHSGAGIAGNPTSSAWWKWSPEATTPVEINTFNSLFDTILAVYTGTSVDNLTLVARNDNVGSTQSRVRFTADASVDYYICVDGKNGAEGPIVVSVIQPGPEKPDNDDYEDAFYLGVGLLVNDIGTNIGGSVQSGEPTPTAEASVWFQWTAPASALVELDTFGSDFDSTLGVYTGSALGSLSQVAFNNNSGGPQSRVIFPAFAGTTYNIAVGGSFGAEGSVDVNLKTLGAYASWVVAHPTLSGSDRSPYADKDKDGFTNLEEMAYGLNPEVFSGPIGTDPNKGNTPSYLFTGSTLMTYIFTLDPTYISSIVNDGGPVEIYGETSSVLSGWTQFAPTKVTGNLYRIQVPITSGVPHVFTKLKIIDPNGTE